MLCLSVLLDQQTGAAIMWPLTLKHQSESLRPAGSPQVFLTESTCSSVYPPAHVNMQLARTRRLRLPFAGWLQLSRSWFRVRKCQKTSVWFIFTGQNIRVAVCRIPKRTNALSSHWRVEFKEQTDVTVQVISSRQQVFVTCLTCGKDFNINNSELEISQCSWQSLVAALDDTRQLCD